MVASLEEIKQFLSNPGKIIIIGASSNEGKAGFYVPKYLKTIGFEILAVNPKLDNFLDSKVYKKFDEIPLNDVKGIVIYRKQEFAEPIALKAVEKGIPMIWLPDKIISEKAEKMAESSGLKFVQDRCPLRDGKRFLTN